MNIKKHVPNLITLSNLFCGILAVKLGFEGEYTLASTFIILGAIFDFFDGFAARLLKVSSNIGAELDSLADMVTFGVAPGVLMYSLLFSLLNPIHLSCFGIPTPDSSLFQIYFPYIGFLIPLLSAVRLAKFNVDENQSDKFIGLPTPANSLFFISIPFIVNEYLVGTLSINTIIVSIATLILIFSWLLNAKIELLALKFKSFGWINNEFRFSFIALTFATLILSFLLNLIYFSIPIIITLYLLISIIHNKQNKTDDI